MQSAKGSLVHSGITVAVILGGALLLANAGRVPVQAQGHVHDFTDDTVSPYTAPYASWFISHYDNSPIGSKDALPCEPLPLFVGPLSDTDKCVAPGCNLSGGTLIMAPGGADVVKWDDFGELGHFVKLVNGKWSNTDGSGYGDPTTTHYRVAREQPSPSSVSIRVQIDDKTNWAPSFPAVYDEDPVWLSTVTFNVSGTRCYVTNVTSPQVGERCSCQCAVDGMSTITPIDGNGSFSVPITSWGYRGDTVSFGLTYSSQSVIDPAKRAWQIPHPAALSDINRDHHYNPKWTHTFAQWVEVTASGTAVWNRADGSRMSFTEYWNGASGPYWRSGESYHTLTSSGSSNSGSFVFEDETTSETVPYGSFVLKDGEGTTYTFGSVRWNFAETPAKPISYAIPYFLLTNITDRWGRTVNVSWSASGVATVKDGDNRGLTFGYTNGLISSITDPFGRVHTIARTNITTPSGGTQPRPTAVTVYGPGSPNRVRYDWAFAYGTAQNDLIVQKTEPTGKVVKYEYEAVNPARTAYGDWDGRLTRAYFYDDLENPTTPVLREITRSGNTITYPGGDSYTFTYSGDMLQRVTHNLTGTSADPYVEYTYDSFHNLASVRTNLDGGPLASLSYTYTGTDNRNIATSSATDILGNQASAAFNALNLPTSVTATGSAHPSQTTQFVYDGGGLLSQGNLTQIIEAVGSTLQQSTSLTYSDSTRPALPTAVTDPLGRVSQAAYFGNGIPSTVTSPANPLGAGTDALSSTTTLQLNSDELPSLITDAMGHQEQVAYLGVAPPGATLKSWLQITITHLADNSTRKITLDAAGRVVASVNEQNLRDEVDYGRGGQPLRVRRNVGYALLAVTQFTYDARGNVAAVDPPTGSTGRIQFDYRRYNHGSAGAAPTLASPVVYESEATRIDYPDGTYEIFGYDAGEQFDWRYSQTGKYTEVARDALHRITSVTYPAVSPWPAITVTTDYDEFGRVEQSTDASGTSTFTYDDLNRLKTAVPGTGQGATYTYTKDLVNKRWTTAVALAGVSGSWQFGEDSKGRVAEVLNPFGQYTSRQFDPDGKLTKETRANGTVTNYGYTGRDWLSSIEHRLANGTVLDRFDYSYNRASTGVYDPSGHLRKETDAGGRVHGFDFDGLYRMTQETHPDFGAYNYTLDLNNNRTRRQQSTANIYSGYDAHNKLLWTNTTNAAPTSGQAAPYRKYTYNGNGEPTSIEHRDTTGSAVVTDVLEWDGMGKLRKVTSGGSVIYTAVYDGGGDRVQSTQLGTTHTYSYGAGLLYDSNLSTTYTPGVSHRQNGTDSYYHEDWIGSTRYTTDSTGLVAPSAQRWDAFGNLTAATGSHGGNQKWVGGAGYEADGPLGMSLLGARYYDPAVGTFLSRDPIGTAGGINQFGYCDGDPVNSADPSGHDDDEAGDDTMAIAYSVERRNRGIIKGAKKTGDITYQVVDVVASFNPGSAAAMAIDKAGKGNYTDIALMALPAAGKGVGAIAKKIPCKTPGLWARFTGWVGGLFRRKPVGYWPAPGNGRQVVDGITYTGHALERMAPRGLIQKGNAIESRGVPPSVVRNAIEHGAQSPGSTPGSVKHVFENVTVVTDATRRLVITVISKR